MFVSGCHTALELLRGRSISWSGGSLMDLAGFCNNLGGSLLASTSEVLQAATARSNDSGRPPSRDAIRPRASGVSAGPPSTRPVRHARPIDLKEKSDDSDEETGADEDEDDNDNGDDDHVASSGSELPTGRAVPRGTRSAPESNVLKRGPTPYERPAHDARNVRGRGKGAIGPRPIGGGRAASGRAVSTPAISAEPAARGRRGVPKTATRTPSAQTTTQASSVPPSAAGSLPQRASQASESVSGGPPLASSPTPTAYPSSRPIMAAAARVGPGRTPLDATESLRFLNEVLGAHRTLRRLATQLDLTPGHLVIPDSYVYSLDRYVPPWNPVESKHTAENVRYDTVTELGEIARIVELLEKSPAALTGPGRTQPDVSAFLNVLNEVVVAHRILRRLAVRLGLVPSDSDIPDGFAYSLDKFQQSWGALEPVSAANNVRYNTAIELREVHRITNLLQQAHATWPTSNSLT